MENTMQAQQVETKSSESASHETQKGESDNENTSKANEKVEVKLPTPEEMGIFPKENEKTLTYCCSFRNHDHHLPGVCACLSCSRSNRNPVQQVISHK